MLVIADTSPVNYLILVDAIDLLPRLFGEVILPRSALWELQQAGAPEEVARWADHLPVWIQVRAAPARAESFRVTGPWARRAILLAELCRNEFDVLLLLDDEGARQEAVTRRLKVTGTLGVLKAAAANGWIDLTSAFDRLRTTNFRVSARLLLKLLDEDAHRP